MSRWWDESVATLGDAIPLGLVAVLLVLLAAATAAGWYWWPAWLPRWRRRAPGERTARERGGWRRWWRRLRWPRWRWRWHRRQRQPSETLPADAVASAGDVLPDLPAEAFVSLADRLAGEGRFAEAVRERMRAIVRDLVDAAVIVNHPGWTVTELARAAGRERPAVQAGLEPASGLFSEIWYGQRPARADHDLRMRTLAEQVHRALSRDGAA